MIGNWISLSALSDVVRLSITVDDWRSVGHGHIFNPVISDPIASIHSLKKIICMNV